MKQCGWNAGRGMHTFVTSTLNEVPSIGLITERIPLAALVQNAYEIAVYVVAG
jgi:hypothetical protein